MKDLLLLDRVLMANSLRDWLIALGIVVSALLLLELMKLLAIRRLARSAQRRNLPVDDAAISIIRATKFWLVLLVAMELGSKYLTIPHKTDQWLDRIVTVAVFVQAGFWLGSLFDYWIMRSRRRALEKDPASATSLAPFSFLVRMLLWLVILLLALDNLGINVTTLVASLGVGGIAVALAVQNILGDLLASLSIVIDKPFVIGDAIAVDTFSGTVEQVGLKTTRLRSDTGEQIVFSNSDLLKARLRNYKRMQERCVVFSFGVVCETPPDRLAAIPGMVRAIVEAQEKVRFDRAHLRGIINAACSFEVAYWLLTPEYSLYLNTHQAIWLALLHRLEEEGIKFAFPTQTLVLHGGPLVPGAVPAPPAGSLPAAAGNDSGSQAASRPSR